MQEIRLGTIGSGNIVHWMLNGVRQTKGIGLEAVYSRSMEKGRALAQEFGCEKVYTDLQEFLQDEQMNFVYVATPNSLHYEQTRAALLAGKNVICEKPFCTKAAQARELTALAKERGLILVDAVPTCHLPNFAILREQLPKVGRIRLVQSNFSQYSSRYDQLLAGQVPNIFSPQFAGGCLMDINFYNVYMNVALFGKPDQAAYYPNMHPCGVDTSGVVIMNYDGFVSTCAGAKDTWGVNYLQIEGEKGYIYVAGGSASLLSVRVVTREGEETYNEQTHEDRWLYEVQSLTRQLGSGDFREIYRGLDVMVDVMEILENTRKEAGIFFPGD